MGEHTDIRSKEHLGHERWKQSEAAAGIQGCRPCDIDLLSYGDAELPGVWKNDV